MGFEGQGDQEQQGRCKGPMDAGLWFPARHVTVAPGCLLKPHTQGQTPPQRVTAAFNAEGRHDAMRTSFHKGQEMTRDPDAR